MTLRNFAERMTNRKDFHWCISYNFIVDNYGLIDYEHSVMGCADGEDVLEKTPDEILDMYELKNFGMSVKENTMFITLASFELIKYDEEIRNRPVVDYIGE